MSEMLTLKIVTPVKEYNYEKLESVRLSVSDDEKGGSGGSYGIRRGHAKALLCLGEGKIYASCNGEKMLEAVASSGFATIEDNIVSVIVDEFQEM